MSKLIKILLLSFFLIQTTGVIAQEFDLNVKVSAPNLATADPKLFGSLEKEIQEFYNSTTWTDDGFEDHERISGNIQLTIKEELSATSFRAELVIQTTRPVFNSTYTTPTMRYLDKNVAFTYDGLRPIQATEDGYNDNFSSILSFFAYFMIGMDYDSFSNLGGDPYFDQAFTIYNNLPSNLQRGDQGWTSDDKSQQNRYYLIENVRSPRFKRFREAFYNYHRLGMDKMYDNFKEGRKVMLASITDVGRVNKEANDAIVTKMFSDTKRIEIIDVFKVGSAEQKTQVKNVMMSIDPTQSSAYRELK